MNKDIFIKIVKDPGSITAHELESLDVVLKSFPFCNAATILAAKGNNDKGSMFSDQKIKRAALFSGDRSILKKIIEFKQPIVDDSEEPEPLKTVIETPQPETKTYEPVKNIYADLEETLSKLKHSEEEFLKHEEIEEKKVITAEAIVNISTDDEIGSALAKTILSEKKTSDEPVEENKEVPLRFYVHKLEFGKDIRKASVDLIAEYLSYRGEINIEKQQPEDQAAIIQKFIEVSPQVSRFSVVGADVPKADLSLRSTVADDDLVTENLANILVKQEKYKKAIEVYQKLNLKYPDKSSYFAEKINNLNSLIK